MYQKSFDLTDKSICIAAFEHLILKIVVSLSCEITKNIAMVLI